MAPRTVEHTPEPALSWREAVQGLVDEPQLRSALSEACRAPDGAFWECVPTSRARQDDPFRFVLVDSPAVARLRPDPGPFRQHLQEPVATFPNLGGDAVLVAPPGAVPEGCAHLAAWCRSAPVSEQHALWAAVGRAVLDWWDRKETPVWVSTSGLGVSWLHVRLDTRPKYITHRPYRASPAP